MTDATPGAPYGAGTPGEIRPLDADALARRSGLDTAGVRRLVDLGIVHERDDGRFRDDDVTAVRLALALESSGIPLEDVASAIRRGEIPPLDSVLLLEPIGLLPRTYGEVADELGLDVTGVRAMTEALGLPEIELDAPVREDDAELLSVAASATAAGLPLETVLVTLRIFAEHLDRIAEHQRELFRRDVQDGMLASGMPRADMLRQSAAIRRFLVSISFRTSHVIHRRLLERHAFENTAEQLEILLDELGIRPRPGRDPASIVFVDLSGYTRLTEEEGDERAAERGSQLAQIVRGASGRNAGRVVKLLGDGAMVRFERADDAVTAATEIVDAVDASPLPAAHVGIAAGPMIRRDGDYFGRTVNVAARLCDAATGGSILASAVVGALTPDRGWSHLGEVELRGIPEPVAVVELKRRS